MSSLGSRGWRLRGSLHRALGGVTRRLPEGPWDPTKIPRIQILMSRDVFLVRVGGPPFPQVESQIGRTRSVHAFQLDGTDRSHNPKVGGSNPPPPLTERRKGPLLGSGPSGTPGGIPRQIPRTGVPLKRCLLWLWHEWDEPTHNHHREQLNPLQLTPIRASPCRLYVIAPLDGALAAGQGHS
jgi:hypothetical protein